MVVMNASVVAPAWLTAQTCTVNTIVWVVDIAAAAFLMTFHQLSLSR